MPPRTTRRAPRREAAAPTVERLRHRLREIGKEVERLLEESFDDYVDRHLHDTETLWDDVFISFEFGKVVGTARVLGVPVDDLCGDVARELSARRKKNASTGRRRPASRRRAA